MGNVLCKSSKAPAQRDANTARWLPSMPEGWWQAGAWLLNPCFSSASSERQRSIAWMVAKLAP